MFTGLITQVGELIRVAESDSGRALSVAAGWHDLVEGESIALDGACLTVLASGGGNFTVAAVETTLHKTTIGEWKTGRRVNLERALRAGDRLGGHLVQGHVDGMAEISAIRRHGDAWIMEIALWEGAEGLCIPQGSIAIDGVSLTVHAIPSPRAVAVSLIEYTRAHTTLGARNVGEHVNIELDVIGKYVRQMAAPWSALSAGIS